MSFLNITSSSSFMWLDGSNSLESCTRSLYFLVFFIRLLIAANLCLVTVKYLQNQKAILLNVPYCLFQALSKALLALRAEMTAHAEQQIISAAAQKEDNLNIQQIVDRQTKDLKVGMLHLNTQFFFHGFGSFGI